MAPRCACIAEEDHYPVKARKNGWTWPLNPLQFTAWFFTLYFVVFHNLVIAPSFVHEWRPLLYITVGILFAFYTAVHLAACSVDPADDNVRRLPKKKEVARLDRKEHPKVIEDQYCYVCETNVSDKAKHCAICQKCIQGFDHHCRWLNNCIGERNYRLFILTLVSAIAACLFMLGCCIALIVWYFTDVNTGNGIIFYHDVASFMVFYLKCPKEVWLAFIIVTSILLLVALGLLIHLLVFHIKLYFKSLSTYEYILQMRKEDEERARAKEVEDGKNAKNANSRSTKQNQVAPDAASDKERCLASQWCTCGDKAVVCGTNHVYSGWKPNPRLHPPKWWKKKNQVDAVPMKAGESPLAKKPSDAVAVDMPAESVAVDMPSDAVAVDMPTESVAVEMPIEVVIPVEIPAEMLQIERKGNWKVSLARFFAWSSKKAPGKRQITGKPFYNRVSPV